MPNGCISIDRVLSRLDEYLNKNDYAAAERHLLYWLDEAERGCDARTALTFSTSLWDFTESSVGVRTRWAVLKRLSQR